jgi:DNA-binding CsgD family transcriptional regulator
VPTLVVGAVHACYGLTDQRTATVALVEYAGETYRVLSSPRPEVALMRRLSPAEYSVTRLLVEGASHAEIASRRGASTRTVANQLATVFQKLRISGRSELLCLALRLRSLEPEAGKPARTPAAPTAPVPAPISQALAPALMLPGARAATY